MRADVHRFGLIDPGDVTGLRNAIERGSVNPREIVAVIGKTHGFGRIVFATTVRFGPCIGANIGFERPHDVFDLTLEFGFATRSVAAGRAVFERRSLFAGVGLVGRHYYSD